MDAKKNEKVYKSWTIYVNDRLSAVNIINYAYRQCFDGSIHRETVFGDAVLNMYKVSIYGRTTEDSAKAMVNKIRSYGEAICEMVEEK